MNVAYVGKREVYTELIRKSEREVEELVAERRAL